MNIVFKNFSELVTLSQDNNTDIPQKIYKEYHEIVYLLITIWKRCISKYLLYNLFQHSCTDNRFISIICTTFV